MIPALFKNIQMICMMYTAPLKTTIQTKKRKILIVFDDMIADTINKKKLNLVVTELFNSGRKLGISIVFITQSYFKVPKNVKLNSTHFFIEELQYDINREPAKISVLSSGKIDKYEYLTGEEILPSNKQQIIEQVKFTYSPLGKAFEKQTKTIKDQGEKQIEAIQGNKLPNTNDDYKNKLLLSKKREIFKNIYNERLDKIEELNIKKLIITI